MSGTQTTYALFSSLSEGGRTRYESIDCDSVTGEVSNVVIATEAPVTRGDLLAHGAVCYSAAHRSRLEINGVVVDIYHCRFTP